MKPNGKCIAKKCEDCNFYYSWDMTNDEGLRKQMNKCVFLVLSEEIPRIRGSVDGVQQAANESRNRAVETKQRIEDLGGAIALTLDKKLIGSQ
jgi:hypothetical protein